MRLKIVCIGVALLILLAGCADNGKPLSQQRFLLDTTCSISLYDKKDDGILSGAFALIDQYERMLSRTIEGSDIWRVNQSGGQPCEVSEETAALLELATRYSGLSGGLFDVTVGAETALWDFDDKLVPDPVALEAAARTVGYEQLRIEGRTVTLANPETWLDLGAIAKGYIADRVRDYLLSQGVNSAIINLGGNVLAVGEKPGGLPWRIGVRQPFEGWESMIGQIEVRNLSVVTSGIYERGFRQGEEYYHHILNPQTGYPADTGLESVTIISEMSVDGDCLSTVSFLLGPDRALEMVERLDGIEAIFIDSNGVTTVSSGIGTVIPFTPEES